MLSRSRSSHARPGLTLMELIVVLAILIALASILIPLFPSMLGRAHKASESTNINEINKAVQAHDGLYQGFPNGFDLLTDGTGTTLVDYLPAEAGTPVAGQLTAAALTQPHVDALAKLGVTNGWPMVATLTGAPADFTPTFSPYSATTPVPLSTSTSVAYVTSAGMASARLVDPLTIPTGDRGFILFGIGSRCTMVGKSLADAPVQFADKADLNAAKVYARYGVVFRVQGASGNDLAQAQFVGAVAIEDDGIEGIGKDLEGYYNKFGQ